MPRDYVKARELYEQAAAKDNDQAMNNLGGLYETGHGVPQDYARPTSGTRELPPKTMPRR